MLTSLFGDLGSAKDANKKRGAADAGDGGFAATAIMESVATEVNDRGQMVDRHLRDLVVTGSPAQAIREHFAATRSDLETASRQITLIDPMGIWAPAVIKALSDAGGQPVERLHLREHGTLRTLAMIERTTLVRRHEDTLRIYHADVRAPGRDNAEVPVALMERSHMTTVIIGPMQPHAIDELLQALYDATHLPSWRCPNLLFMLPPGAAWIASKIGTMAWPARLNVHVINEPLISASSVWNAMLGLWNHVKTQPGWEPAEVPPTLGESEFPIRVADLEPTPMERRPVMAAAAAAANNPTVMRMNRLALDPARARHALVNMLGVDGLLGCAVVDSTTGLVLAREVQPDHPVDIELAAAASAQVLRAHRQGARSMGLPEHVDEVMTSAGGRQQVMRTISRHPELFLMALLDKQRTNLALARFKLMDIERGLE
jgi:hypothetical protein